MNPYGIAGTVITAAMAKGSGGKDPIISTKIVIGVVIGVLLFVGVLLGLHYYFPFK